MASAKPDAGDPLGPVFRALAHPVRRRLLDLLKGGALSTGDLAAAFPEYSRFAIMQHLATLETAGLVVAHRDGRLVLHYLNAAPLREVYERWVGGFEGHWAAALVGLKRELEMPPNERAARRANAKRAESQSEPTEPRAHARDEAHPARARARGSVRTKKEPPRG